MIEKDKTKCHDSNAESEKLLQMYLVSSPARTSREDLNKRNVKIHHHHSSRRHRKLELAALDSSNDHGSDNGGDETTLSMTACAFVKRPGPENEPIGKLLSHLVGNRGSGQSPTERLGTVQERGSDDDTVEMLWNMSPQNTDQAMGVDRLKSKRPTLDSSILSAPQRTLRYFQSLPFPRRRFDVGSGE